MPRRVLLLGGTSEARALAARLVADGIDVTSSLAGRVAHPRLPEGQVRIGGFGGVDGLRKALADFDVVVDATHPFSATISANALRACAAESVPLLRLQRPGWAQRPLAAPIGNLVPVVERRTKETDLSSFLGNAPGPSYRPFASRCGILG